MRPDLIRRREAARDRQDAALAHAKGPGDPQAHGELSAVLQELERIHLEVDEANSDPHELARVHSYMADVLFELGAGTDSEELRRGLRLYDRALGLVGSAEPQRSKVTFNRANTLRGLSRGQDRELLGRARDGFKEALTGFQKYSPALVPAARDALGLVERQLALLGQAASLDEEQRNVEDGMRVMGERLLAIARGGGAPVSSDEGMLAMLYARYRKDLDAEKIPPERRKILDGVFNELFAAASSSDRSVEALQHRVQKSKALILRLNELMAPPASIPVDGSPGSRRTSIERELHQTRTVLLEQSTERFRPERDAAYGQELMRRLFEATTEVRGAAADAAVAVLERDVLRGLCLEIREFTRRKHLALARPVWSADEVARQTSTIFFSGGPGSRGLARVEAVARPRGMTVVAAPLDGMDPAESRWRQLRAANIAVFDLTAGAADRHAAYYELGIARALGTEVLILADRARPLPFDVEVDPVFEDEDLGAAVDRALYRPLTVEAGDSVATFVASFTSTVGTVSTTEGRYVMGQLAAESTDATRIIDLFAQLRGAERLPFSLLRPTWAAPAQSREKRCFHVMPFGPDWAADVRDGVARTCESHGVAYVRGDVADDARIIHSIWNEICRASHIVVDITGLNPNVLVELGMTHTLGRPCLVVAQTGPDVAGQLVQTLAKFRVTSYRIDDDLSSLRAAVVKFLRG